MSTQSQTQTCNGPKTQKATYIVLLKTGKTLAVQATTKTSINRILKKTGRPQDAEDVVEERGAWGDVVTVGYDILKGKFVRTKVEPRHVGAGVEGGRANP